MISFSKTPFPIDFAKNNPRFEINTNSFIQVGIFESWSFIVNKIPFVNGVLNELRITSPYTEPKSVTILPSPMPPLSRCIATTNPNEIENQLLRLLCTDPALLENYFISIDRLNGKCRITFTARVAETQSSHINLEYRQDGTATVFVDGEYVIETNTWTNGRTPNERSNYKLVTQYLVRRIVDTRNNYLSQDESYETIESPKFILIPHNGKLTLDTQILRSFFYKMDIPALAEPFAAYRLKYCMLEYWLRYQEIYEGQENFDIHTTSGFYLCNARIQQNHFYENEPDWDTHREGEGAISDYEYLLNWGTPYQDIIRTYKTLPQYAYVANLTDSNRLMSTTVHSIDPEDRTEINHTLPILTIPAHTICRIPIDIHNVMPQYENAGIYTYQIIMADILSNRTIINKTIEIIDKPYYAKEFLFQNHLGIAEFFYSDMILVEKNIEGQQIIVEDDRITDISSTNTIITLHSGWKTKAEMRLLADALENQDNYLLDKNVAFHISFVPNTFQIIDEKEDLQSCDVQFTIGVPIIRGNENINIINANEVLLDEISLRDNIQLLDI